MSTPSKRRNFTEQEDIMLLRQVSLEMPFQARRGQVMERWAAVASALLGSDEFTRDDIDAKRACNRFMLLLDGHRKSDKESQRASGVSEEVGEKTILLDDLMSAYDDTKAVEAQRADETREAADHAEAMGSFIRAEAMKSMGKRKREKDEEDSATGGGKIMKVFSLMHEQAKAELEFQKEKFDKEYEERRKDREIMMEQMRQQQESMNMLIRMLINKS